LGHQNLNFAASGSQIRNEVMRAARLARQGLNGNPNAAKDGTERRDPQPCPSERRRIQRAPNSVGGQPQFPWQTWRGRSSERLPRDGTQPGAADCCHCRLQPVIDMGIGLNETAADRIRHPALGPTDNAA
jgi:hypothetical protein